MRTQGYAVSLSKNSNLLKFLSQIIIILTVWGYERF